MASNARKIPASVLAHPAVVGLIEKAGSQGSVTPDEVRRVSDIFVATDSRAHAAASHAFAGLDAEAGLGDIQAPTLVLVGRDDYATPPAMAQVLASGIPRARLEVLDDTRHLSLIERPDLWPLVEKHLDS